MVMVLFDLFGGRIRHALEVVGLDHPCDAVRAGARRVRSNIAPAFRVEVAIWALLQSVAVWMTIATAMLLAGCASFGDAQTKSTLRQPDSYAVAKTLGAANTATDAVVAAWPTDQWWKQFADPQLDALIDEALAGDGIGPLRQAEARLRNAQAVVRGAQSREYPSLALNAGSDRERYTEHYIYPPPLGGATYTLDRATLDFGYDLDFWGRNRAAIAGARSQAEATKADAQASRLAVTTSIARAWFQLQRLGALRDVTLAAIRQRDDVLSLARQRFDAGLDTNAELRQAEAAVPVARVDLAQIEESAGLVRNQIAALLGKGPDRGREIGFPHGTGTALVALPTNLPAELLGRRPDLVAARWRVEAARAQIDVAKAQFYPNINLVASAGFLAFGASNFLNAGSRDLSGGAALSLPIFEGGALRANLAGRNADYDVAVEQYNTVLVDAVRDVADQIVSIQSVNAQFADQALARVKTEEAYDVAVIRYRAGLTTYLTVLNAQTAVLQQQRADAELRARVLDLDVALARALGGGYRSDAVVGQTVGQNASPVAAR
jgi:NodT family efflux transporter outer membrane factor (OMF) lipoprotein